MIICASRDLNYSDKQNQFYSSHYLFDQWLYTEAEETLNPIIFNNLNTLINASVKQP